MISTPRPQDHAPTRRNTTERGPERLLRRSIRRELLDQILNINPRHATTVLSEYEHHYNDHRPHRSLDQAAPLRPLPQRTTTEIGNVRRHYRLGGPGLLHEYQQVA
jgi:putative transposase